MPPKKYALKGEPDFHTIGDERLKSYVDCVQQMIFAYKGHDDSKVKVLQDIWKDLSAESTERLCKSPDVVAVPAPLMRKVPKIRKSPAKR